MTDFYGFVKKHSAFTIDPGKPFSTKIDLTPFVKKFGADFICSECQKVLVRIEPGGILGEEWNHLDTTVILNHHLTKHAP
jgi:hypothetical protein